MESSGNSYSQPAENLSHNVTQEEQDHYERTLQEDSKKQIRTPWHREGVDQPPAEQQRSKAPLTKGTWHRSFIKTLHIIECLRMP